MSDMRKNVLRFIARFHGSEDVFLHGCCYWFAHILQRRFAMELRPHILYEPVEGHFVTSIGGRLYDVRGDVTDLYTGHTLEDTWQMQGEDFKRYMRLMRDCRDFIDPEEE